MNLKTNTKVTNITDLYRGINDSKKGHQPRTNIVKDEKSDLVAVSHSILSRWRNYFSQLLNIHGFRLDLHLGSGPLSPDAPRPF